MANTLSKTGITTAQTIKAAHVTQSIDALTGHVDYDITISGSLKVTGSTNITGSLNVTHGVTGSFTGSFKGDGQNLTGVTAEWDGTHNGNATITGSLLLSGSGATKLDVKGDVSASGNITASGYISGSTLYATNGLKVNSISSANSSAEIITFGSMQLHDVQELLADGRITASRFTASNGFYGTSSWSVSASSALTASHAMFAEGSFPHSGSAAITGSLIVTGSTAYQPRSVLCSGSSLSPATQLTKDDRIVFIRNTRTSGHDVGHADLDIGPFVTNAQNVGKIVDIYWQFSSGNKDTILKNVGMSGTTYINGTQSVNETITVKSSSGDDHDLNAWVRIIGMGYESCSVISNQIIQY